MAIDRNKLKQIYSTLQSGGYRQDYQTFEKGFTNKDNYATRKKTYDLLTAHGAQIGGSYEEFMKKLQVSGSHSSMRTGKSGVAGGHPLSEAEKQQMMGNATRLAENAKAIVSDARNRIANQMAIVKKPLNASSRIGENKNVRGKGYSYNPNSGKLEKTYVTTLGNEYNSRYDADQEQKQIDRLNHDSSLGGQLENAYAERERLDKALTRRKQEIDKGGNKLTDFLRELAGANSGGPMASRDASRAKYDNDSEYQQLMAAARKNHTTIQLLEDKKNNKMNEFWHNVGTTMLNGYTFSDGLSEMQDAIALQEAEKHLDSINKKRAKGEKLTRDEQNAESVLKNFATDDAMQGQYGDDYGAWGRAGKMFATSIDYGKDFLLNPGGAMLAKGMSKSITEGLAKGIGRLVGKDAEKVLANKAMRYSLKATGVLVGTHIAGLAVANTTAVGKTVGQLGTATSGHVVADDKGSYHVVDKQKLLPALVEVERSQAREYGSEMIGEFLPGGKILKKGLTKGLEKIGLSKVASTFTNIGTKQWYKQYSNLLKAGGYNGIPGEVMEEYEGSLFDALTGHADDAWRDMTSLRNHVDIWLGCGTMGAIMGAVPMMGAVNHTANYYGYKHKTDKADKVASSLVGDEKWGAIRDKIDQTENGKMADVLVDILTDKELNDNAKNATLDYVRNLTKMRGYNIANVNCAAEESMEATHIDQHEGEAAQLQDRQNGSKNIAERMNASYGMGYNATDAPSMYDADVTLKAQENRLSKLLGVDDVRKAMGEDPMAFVEKRKQAGASAEELQAMEDFLVADSAVKGIRQRMTDNLDSRLSESDAEMEKRINTEDGMVHKAVMQVRNQDGKEHEVYVLKGNVRMNADGRGVDASSSDNEIYVYDPQEGKTRMMPPSFIERIDEPVDAETVRRSAGESIRQDYQSELAKLDTSGLSFQVGDRYDAVDERGVQHRIEVVGGAVDDAGNAMNGYVGVRVDGGEAVSMRTDEIAKMVGNADVQRREAELSGEASEDGHASDADHAVDADDVPTYAQNEVLTLLDEHGNPVRAEITAAANEDGLYEVLTDEPIDGKRVSMMSAEEIAAAEAPLNPPGRVENEPTTAPLNPSGRGENEPTKDLQDYEGGATNEAAEPNDEKSALARIPMDEETKEPRYEDVDADTAWDAIVEQTNGDKALAQEVVDDTVNEMSAGIEKAEKAISKATFKGKGIQERIAFAKDKQERMAALASEKEKLSKWKRIAAVERMRAAAVEAEKSRAASAERKARQEEEEKARLAREEAERKEREALNGVPNMTEDKPSDARARGYRRVDGHKVDRQAPVKAVKGKEVQVKFDDKNIPAGHVAVVDASELQPSHIGGQRNAKHFIDEAQPKERKDDASVEAARKIASNIRPEEITTSVTAYTGAPTVNSRGEVIQGNNRSAALKEMWANYPGQGARYKQYLKEHAAEYGLTAEDIDKVQSPVLVNMLDVSDADAIALGQFVASDTESGGTERLKPKNVTKKLGGRMKTFSNILLRSSDDESSFSELLDRNGMETLKWLNGIGAITPTQYKSSFDSKGNLTAEAKNDLKGVLYQYVFEGGSTQLEEMFNGLPAKAQRAILSTAYRDYESVKDERMIEEIQDSIMAYHALSQDAQFMSATNHKDARAAVESWKRQYAIDDVTGESYLPSEKFSNFTLLLAAMYKGDTQSYIQAKFNAMYDLIQGVREDTLFGTPDNTPRTLAEAINEILNIDYDGQQRSDVLVGGNQVSQARETGSPAGAERGEQSETGEQPTDSGAGTEGDTGKQVAHKDNTLFQYFTGSLADMIARAKLSATDFAKKVLAPVSSRLKEDLQAHGVKLDGDFNHVIDNAAIRHTLKQHGGKNEEKRGQIPITDADFGRIPDVVENYDEITVVDGKRGDVNIIYSRTYEDGTTVFVEEKREKRKELAAVTMWKKQSPTLTDANRENTTPISDLSETSFGGKDTNNLDTKQENEEKVVSQAGEPLSEKIESASEDVDTAPTEAQKEAGNYKKGHVQVGKFDITIEQPRGSIRKGTDANGKAWESKMHNTYGYIRGTVGVDGDHIDVFLSNDIDGWDGRKMYVVDQYNPDGSFDEHKVMLGFNDMDKAKSDYLANYEKGWEKGRRIDVSAMDLEDFERWIASSKRKTKPFAKYAGLKKKDSQGNPLNADGTLKLEKVKSVDDLTDEDFSKPTRSVELPELPENVDRALGADGKPVIIKKNIFEKNWEAHKFPFAESRSILKSALYNTDLVGQTQPTKRPLHWVAIKLDEKSPIVVLEVNESKNNVEIVGWYTLDGRNLDRIKRQAEKNGGELVMLSPKDKVESLSTPQSDLSSDNKDSKVSDTKQENLSENDRANLAELSDFAVNTDSAKRTTVDAAGFDSENLTVSLLIDGKPSRLSVATIVPDVITDRSYQTAVYDYSDDIDNKTNSGWQKWEDLSDEYNSKVSEEERASVFGDSAELHFKTVDAAVKFDDWLRSGRIEKQQRADELRNDTAAKQLATNAVLYALDNAGISVEVVSDEAASEMLGRNEAMAESANEEDFGTTDHVQFMRMGGKKKSTLETASPDNQDHQTVVSSADGAKVLNDLDNLVKEYEISKGNKPNTFIGDVSKAVGATRQGSASEYASFETKSGKTVTIRLSNHNAKVSTFDAHDEAEGISIVVTPKENKGIFNDGNAHVTEFYYNAIKLRRAEGKPLVEILKSIKQALYSGAYTDNTGLAEVKEVNVPTASDGQTDSGKVYGWTADGKIFLTKDGINPNTPIHEYTHLWAGAMRQRNEKGWQRVKNLLKGTPIWDEVLNDPNYRAISADEDAVASEALSRISGRENAKKMEAEAQRMIDEADGIAEKAEAVSLLDRMRRALDAFWRWIGKNLFGIKKFESIEEVTDRVLYDLTTGTDLQNDRSLMAVHNISVDKLESALELGGFPMPSIAITNANMGHAGYGEISLVFGKESVDPSDSRNKVYSGDAWTPTFPQIGYKLNDKKTNEIYKRANEVGSLPLFNPVHFHPDNYEGKIDRRGDASLVDRFKEDYGAKQMYLAEKGNAVRAFVQHEVPKYSPEKVSLYKKILETIGLERLKNDSLDSVKSDLTALGVSGKSPKYYERIILCAIDYAEHGNSKIENDIDATEQEIDKRIDGKSFSAWLEELFSGVVEKKGIRNERDRFTPSGNSRKWESLYDAVTLDNVIKSMQRQAKKGGEGFFNSSIFGASTKELPSIDAVRREAKLRINSIPDEKMEKAKGRIIERLEKVRIPSVEKGVADAFDFVDNVISAVSASHSPSGIYKYLHAYYPDMTMDAAKEISDIVGEIQKMSAKYFEAKPYRAVGFDEVRAAVVPNDVPQEIIDGLRKRGVKVVSYEKGNEQERKDALSSVTREMDIRFQIKGKDEVDAENGERHREDAEEVNEQYNSELAGLTEENADTKIFNLGRPSSILLSAGVEDKPMKLYGNKVVKKMKKHGFALDELRNLPKAVADPIAVFDNIGRIGNRSILTELRTQKGNFLVTIDLGKGGDDVDFNIVSSVFGKDGGNIVDWIERGLATYINKEKAFRYLHHSALSAEALSSSRLSSAAKIVKDFVNPSIAGEESVLHSYTEQRDELDKRYMAAVKRGDMVTAQRMVNEAARRSGYFPGSNYQGTSAFNGSAPYGNGYFTTPEERKEAFENDEFDGDTTLADYVTGGIDPMNLDFLLGENNYRHSDAARKEAIDNIREVVRTKGQRVTMYRSVPSSVKEGSFRNGDWVSPSRKYAEENARVHGWGNAYHIIAQDVPISDVWFDGNDIAEWGYGSEADFLNDKDYLYGNTKNNRKLPDAVTYDDNGDVIPLSKRFDTMNGDLRFRVDKNFENPNVSDENVLRERHGANGDEDISLSHDPMSKLLGESAYTDAQRKAFVERERKRMAEHVSELAEKLNLDNVDVVTDASTLNGNRRRAKGFFNKKTGRITIVIPNHTDMADVEKTLLHEAVAHHGLRKLFGENFDNFLDNVYRNAEYDIRKRISEMSSNHGWDVRTATEEYLAGLAEDTNFENMPDGFWSKIKRFFLQMLHSIGLKNLTDVSMGNNELRYVLWRSYENLKEPGRYRNFFAEAADVAKQHQLKVGPYEVSDRADRANVADRTDRTDEASKADNERKETTLASMKQSVAELFEKAKTGEFVGKPASIGRLSSEGKAYLEKLSGLQFKEFVDFVLNPSDLNHIRSNHYGENEKDKSNNVPLTDADILNMVDVLNAPDAILYGIDKNDGRKLFFFLKDAGNGLYNLTEVCSTKKGNLTAKSFFKTKKKGISQRVMEIKNSLLPTSVTYSGESLSSRAKIPTFFENSKFEEDYSVRDGANEADVLYRSGVERTVERVPDIVVSQLYEDAVKDTRDRTLLGALVRTWSKDGRTRFKNKFAESYFDYSRSVKALQDAIAKATGRKVEWFEDVWKSLNAKSSIDEREQEVMSRTLTVPLSRHISSMVRQSGGKYDLDAIEAYLNAKHGLERNELMARRAAEEAAEEAYGAEIEQCRKALAADALDTTAEERLQELTSQYDAMVEESYAANRRDYAGLTALFDPEQEGKRLEELEDAARKYISEIEGYYDADTVDGLWDKVRALNNFSLQKSYECGLLSKKQYDDVSKMYKWYVPLRGWHDNYAGDVYNYVNRGADRGMIENAVKKAYGRTSRAGNILGTMSAMANSAIVVGNKNKVAQVFMNLALNHEDTGMFTISEAWYEKNEADDSWRIVTPDNRIHEDMSAEEVADTIAEWEDEMREKAANGKALMRSGKFSKDFRHSLEAWKEQQHCVRVSRGGKEYLVYVNGNPRATQAINGLLNPDYQPGIAENILQKYMRHLARVQTSWSPKFVMSNLQRDMLTATGSAYAKHGAGYSLKFEQNFAMNTKDIFGLFYKDLHGSLDTRNDKERMFKEFLDNGGKTGISAIGKKQEYEEKYNKSIRRAMHPASSAAMQGAEGIVQGVEFMNSCIENLTRFSTYITSRQMGKSIKDAIFDAKECSVNFNMKGSGAWGNATLRKYILYTNPALQALRMLNSWYDANNVRTVGMLASGVAMGFTVAMVNAMCNGGDGDDNAYYGLSDYNRYTYFNIGIGNRKFLHWRLPQEMSPLYALGHISYDLMTERISTERAIQMSLEQLNNYSPLSLIEGNPNYDQSADNTYAKTFLKGITPSYLSPFTDAFLWDEDFLGRSIGNRNEWNKRKPEWQRVDKRTPEWFIKPFEAIGKATGSNGSDRKGLTNSPVFNPSAWWYVLMQQGGGLAQVGEQAFNACAVVLGSKDADDMELKDYPLVSTVLVDAGTDNARMRIKNERFWMYRSEYEANKATISNITHSRDLSPVEKAEKTSLIQDSRYNLVDFFMKKHYKPLREDIAEAEANGDKAEVKRLKGMLNEEKGMLLERIDEASPSPSPKGRGEQAPS